MAGWEESEIQIKFTKMLGIINAGIVYGELVIHAYGTG